MTKKNNWIHEYKHMMDIHLRRSLCKSIRLANKTSSVFSVIIQFKQKRKPNHVQSCKQLMGTTSFTMRRQLRIINAISVETSMAGLKKLCQTKIIHRVYLNRKVKGSLDIATPAIGSRGARRAGLTGKGVTIAILDSGIYRHPDLKNRIIGFKDLINHRKTPYDDLGHGTHVAGCLAGNGSRSTGRKKYIGAAPQATLVGVKVLNNKNAGTFEKFIAGIQWTVTNRKRLGIRIINLSVGVTAYTSCKKDPLCQAIEKAVRAGLVVVAAAGNTGPAERTINTPGISPSVITVGSVNDQNTIRQSDDTIASFTSRGPTKFNRYKKPDLLAPGVNITSLRVPGSTFDKQFPSSRVGTYYFTLSGTSFSTPLVSGVVAQLLQKHPTLTPRQVKALLMRNAVNLGSHRNTQGSGEVNIRFLFSNRKATRVSHRKQLTC